MNSGTLFLCLFFHHFQKRSVKTPLILNWTSTSCLHFSYSLLYRVWRQVGVCVCVFFFFFFLSLSLSLSLYLAGSLLVHVVSVLLVTHLWSWKRWLGGREVWLARTRCSSKAPRHWNTWLHTWHSLWADCNHQQGKKYTIINLKTTKVILVLIFEKNIFLTSFISNLWDIKILRWSEKHLLLNRIW